ncbi:efflux RND transporter periplasmic adaptor subunit [Dyadobacter flavalbus]|uniref:Efflux RND transporter periplasmic adaptor subunit n=1 Tax=Dyadobacter flavalbus TaxID=2579942 RepID=A0A5M8QWU0_9BACT|nr:efflux RND transporter periplasmic adaptor subunit [Dyadobacter flavalbus]KAA6439126.1 efflux RND transporter periplasmic adaptor subunit [Dyadobacter flavalbus]
MKKLRKKSIILIFAAAFPILNACKKEIKEAPADSTIPVKIISSAALSQAQAIETSGLLTSENEAKLSFKTGGIIKEILVKEGDQVRKGQLLATLNTTEFAAQMSQAEENFLKAKRDAQRTQNLFKDSVNTREQLENSATALLIAEKQLEIVRFNYAQSRMIATTNGVVISKLHHAGEQVQGGSPVLHISSNNSSDWIIQCGLTDKDWTRLKGNEKAEIVFDAYPQIFKGSVKSLSQGSDAQSGLYQAEIRLEEKPAKLATGLFAKVHIYPKEKTNLISVPVDALIEGENDSAFVFVKQGGNARRKAVKIGFLQGDKAFILSGIDAGAQVIREGSAYLTDGSAIKVVQ